MAEPALAQVTLSHAHHSQVRGLHGWEEWDPGLGCYAVSPGCGLLLRLRRRLLVGWNRAAATPQV